MFAGITWGEFALYVGLAVVLYYIAVILIYFRAELASWLSKPKENAPDLARPPAAAGAPAPASPIGASTDYGNLFASLPAGQPHPAGQPSTPPADNHPAPMESPDAGDYSAATGTDTVSTTACTDDDNWDEGVFADDEPVATVLEPEDEDACISSEIDLDNEFVGLEAEETEEIADGGMPVETLVHTVELITREEITPSEKKELSRQLELFDDNRLLETLMENNERARNRIALLMKEASAGGGGEGLSPAGSPGPAGKEAFADVDIGQLIKKIG